MEMRAEKERTAATMTSLAARAEQSVGAHVVRSIKETVRR